MTREIKMKVPDCLETVRLRYLCDSNGELVVFYFGYLEADCLVDLLNTMRKQGYGWACIEPYTKDEFVVFFARKKKKEADENECE